ncbi:peroxisome biogenesis factor 2 [Amyelois transitella]|uniref:peroxisome biogenesis factor 2 n=1 Tax=Amyelois transitella TaxID=680683 RepID=UPI00067B9FBC|nr:peroxisome biogenesis factor 2 [Amyelois transitella]
MSINYIPRVTQLDAVHLDKQVEELFIQQIFQATKYLEPGILQAVLPELELLIRTWIFKFSFYNKKCTFGQEMLSLKYKPENISTSKMYWYYGYKIGLNYVKDRCLYSWTSNTRIQNVIHKMETFQLVGDILNFLRFIQSGKYPMLIDFILGLELTADKLTREDLTDFSWTRELLWHNFIELMGTAISLMNMIGLRSKLSTVLKYVWWRKHTKSSATSSQAVMTHSTVCACCSNKPVLPYTMGCSHIFCYYCLMANKTVDKDYACPKCYFNGKELNKFVMV